MEKQEHKTNQLINSTSPYLRQHAENPVNWLEWNEEAFEKAKKENKLVIVSIGYSACHWCHVMAHESFEDDETAQIMNDHFICIKVDREELPDVDQTYMDACQLINGNGGWPLNAFALPDKRPIHALTYLPKTQWQKLLFTLNDLWLNKPEAAYEYADKLQKGLKGMNISPVIQAHSDQAPLAETMFESFSKRYDKVYGGMGKAPKFPMPNNLNFLCHYNKMYASETAAQMLTHTLDSMALGGIYDQLGAGFARYSVDERWFAPHFEKMLYDNAQLIELYAKSSALYSNDFHKQIAVDSISFCENELKSEEGLYFSALDADSEGVEGLFYTFTYDEISEILGQETVFFSQYFQCRKDGNWEHGRNILYAIDTIDYAATKYEMDPALFKSTLRSCLDKLKIYRDKRIRPGLDNKCICSWNTLHLKALAEASYRLQDKSIREKAYALTDTIIEKFDANNDLKRIYSQGKSHIDAYLEDHASLIDALISVYKCGFKEEYLLKAYQYSERVIALFYDSEKGFFRFNRGEALLNHKYDISDDVINSGNSIMANNLYNLSWYFNRSDWREMALNMLNAMRPFLRENAPWYSHWAQLQLKVEFGTEQLVVAGPETLREEFLPEMYLKKSDFLPGFISQSSQIPLLNQKVYKDRALLYICKDMTCFSPIEIQYN